MSATIMRALGLSATAKHGTPAWLFKELDREFGFTLDVCATPELAKCRRFFSPEDDGLAQRWAGEVCWMNPPYGIDHLWAWMERATRAAREEGATVVCLVPCRTEQPWWHDFVWDEASQRPRPGVKIRYLRRRLTFAGSAANAPFSSAVLVLRPPTGDAESLGLDARAAPPPTDSVPSLSTPQGET